MSPNTSSQPAYPNSFAMAEAGLSKLEYFAALAMQAIRADGKVTNPLYVAEAAVAIAKALATELSKETPTK